MFKTVFGLIYEIIVVQKMVIFVRIYDQNPETSVWWFVSFNRAYKFQDCASKLIFSTGKAESILKIL